MAERHRTSRPQRLPVIRSIPWLAALAVVAALAQAPPASAQDEDVIGSVSIQTTLGTFFVELEEDNPTVRPFARAFASLVKDRTFFHLSDKTIGCDADDPNCFLCTCDFAGATMNACSEDVGVCDDAQNPLPCTNTTPEFRAIDQLVTSRVVHAGVLEIDGGNNLIEANNVLGPPLDTGAAGVFENNLLTVAFVRDAPAAPGEIGEITPEWIINLVDNSDLVREDGFTFDDADDDGNNAYFVIGQVGTGGDIVAQLAGLATTDARCNDSLLGPPSTSSAVLAELAQLPVVDFTMEDPNGEPILVELCNSGFSPPDYPACLNPLCVELSADELSCLDPLCYAVEELETPVNGSTHECTFPVQPNFPLITIAQPSGVTLVANGLAPPEPANFLDFPNNPAITIDIRNVNCFVDINDPPGNCANPGVSTFFEVASGGSAGLLRTSDTSQTTVTGGSVDEIELYDQGRAVLQGGSVGTLTSTDTSDLAMQAGGSLTSWVAQNDSTGLVTGGDPVTLDAQEQSFVRIVGNGFEVDANPVALGPVASVTGILTGTLASGETLDLDFDQVAADQNLYLLATDAMQTPVDLVLVGSGGNPADPLTGFGSVSTGFRIAQTEVTNAEYADFLDAVAKSDPHDLYDTRMETDSRGGIARSGGQGNYSYDPISGLADQPVVFVSRDDAMRYANWLHNRMPTIGGDAATEDGAYLFDAGVLQGGRQPRARYFVPTRDEWYKAAYYDDGTATWFDFPTSSDTLPTTQVPTRDIGNGVNAQGALAAAAPLTDAGAYAFSPSPFGTLDQGGNVVEWLEDTLGLRGGHWNLPGARTQSDAAPVTVANADAQENFLGFRVPEPRSGLLALAALSVIAALRRRVRSRC